MREGGQRLRCGPDVSAIGLLDRRVAGEEAVRQLGAWGGEGATSGRAVSAAALPEST